MVFLSEGNSCPECGSQASAATCQRRGALLFFYLKIIGRLQFSDRIIHLISPHFFSTFLLEVKLVTRELVLVRIIYIAMLYWISVDIIQFSVEILQITDTFIPVIIPDFSFKAVCPFYLLKLHFGCGLFESIEAAKKHSLAE